MEEAIDKLFKLEHIQTYVFVYSPPKVGSTTLVTSLRLSLNKTYGVIHLHDEVMLNVLTGVSNISINDIIAHLSNKGKTVYVIDVYRTPIERKMSEYFEKLAPYHFNNTEEQLKTYDINKIINRFNKLFPHLENGDHYLDKYPVKAVPFDFQNKYTIQKDPHTGVLYIKLRLMDSSLWGSILSNVFQKDVVIATDYLTRTKVIGELYERFKETYRLPSNYLELVSNDNAFNFYLSEEERKEYLKKWGLHTGDDAVSFTKNEYEMYMNVCLENQYINDFQTDHYIDGGCYCERCDKERRRIFNKLKGGEKLSTTDKVIHQHTSETTSFNLRTKPAQMTKFKLASAIQNMNNNKQKVVMSALSSQNQLRATIIQPIGNGIPTRARHQPNNKKYAKHTFSIKLNGGK